LKATIAPQTLTDGSIVFDVLVDGEPVAHAPSQGEAGWIADKINLLDGYRYVGDLFRTKEDRRNADFVRMFLATFHAAVASDEPLNGADTVDRVTEFVRALTTKEGACFP
jgi:hypothetical protein